MSSRGGAFLAHCGFSACRPGGATPQETSPHVTYGNYLRERTYDAEQMGTSAKSGSRVMRIKSFNLFGITAGKPRLTRSIRLRSAPPTQWPLDKPEVQTHLTATKMTYEYLCEACGHRWEAQQSISEAPLTDCPSCRASRAKRQISRGGGFILKGGGWYSDLYSSTGAGKNPSASDGAGDSASAAPSATATASNGASASSGSTDKASARPIATDSSAAKPSTAKPSTAKTGE